MRRRTSRCRPTAAHVAFPRHSAQRGPRQLSFFVRRRRASPLANADSPDVIYPAGDVYCWLEADSSIMLKAVTRFGDPVELSADEVRKIAMALLALADGLEPKNNIHAVPNRSGE